MPQTKRWQAPWLGVLLAIAAGCSEHSPVSPDTEAWSGPPAAVTSFAGQVAVAAIDNSSTPVLVRYEHGTATVASTIPLPGTPHSVDVTPDGEYAFVSLQFDAAVAMVDLSAGSVVATIPVGSFPTQVTVRPDGAEVFVGAEGASSISIIDVATRAVTRTIPQKGEGIAFTPDGQEVYVAGGIGGPNQINVYRVSDLALLGQVPASTCRAVNITMFPSGNLAAVTDDVCGQVVIVSTATRAVSRVITAPNAWSTAVTPDEDRIFVTEPNLNRVQAFDVLSGAHMGTIPAGSGPHELAMTPDGASVYVTSLFSNTTAIIDVATTSVSTTLTGFSRPVGVAILPPPPGTTPVGSDVTVQPVTPGGDVSPVTLTFTNVTGTGTTTLTTSGQGAPPPQSFKLGNPPVYYDLTTTATYTGAITVCFAYDAAAFRDPSRLKLFHGGPGGGWTDVTTSNDLTDHVICGTTSSLSPFILAELRYDFTGFFQPVDNPGTANTVNRVKAGSAIPVKFSLDGNHGLDVFEPGNPGSQVVDCMLASVDNIEQSTTAGASSLSYDPASDQYTYVWKTEKTWAGTCRQFVVGLKDGTRHRALFHFTK